MPGLRQWGVESERDMYYATKRNNTTTRAIGLGGVVVALAGSGYALANGLGLIENKAPVESEVVIIEELEEVVEEEPPPPPVDVDLPRPPRCARSRRAMSRCPCAWALMVGPAT